MLLWSDMADMGGITDWRGAALELIRRILPANGKVLLVGPHPQAVVDEVAALAGLTGALAKALPEDVVASPAKALPEDGDVSTVEVPSEDGDVSTVEVLSEDGDVSTAEVLPEDAVGPGAVAARPLPVGEGTGAPDGEGASGDQGVGGGPDVGVLVRSYPDACALGERHPGLAVFCGRLEAFRAEEPYDLVLALDGLLRTHSAEAPAAAWIESLDALAALVAPGGRLVLGVRNDLGVDRFLEARPADRDGGDDQWAPHGFDPSYPSGPGALDAGLESAGLTVQRCYAAYPGRQAPRALLAREALAFDLPDALAFPLSARNGDRMLVADPLRLTRLVFRHRLGEELAPMWLAVATRSPLLTAAATGTAADEASSAALPAETVAGGGLPLGLVQEGELLYELTRAGLKQLPDGDERPIPAGRVLEEMLVEACAREDTRTVRELLSALAGWLEDGGTADAAGAATDSLVYDGTRFTPIGDLKGPSTPPEPRIVLCRILWRFAVRLQAAGHHHPWPWPLEADQLTLTLCGMAGRPCDPGDLDRARKLDAELGHPVEQAEHAPTYRDLLSARDRLADQLTAALARIARLETKLSYRERELVRAKAKLRRTQRKATAYRRTLGYRLSRRLARPRRVARKVFRLLSG
ncbi:hypothetical protein MF672_047700 [Actinomadura sp. ATCC 31491]|uniref:Class I SAM-dependent methyltransferase n=1 Tax=Actinomadura luzonensis TaxID=2805427 RepID=A0ABT0GA10_9ACTN|nr:hypothetical protein [Actinomadura luzonensis]MCK2221441.1 hypothetical protein [Actinomadura luzonensis]